jgi:plastocyanin
MSEHKIITIGLAALFTAILGLAAHNARADDAVSISVTIKNHQFDPAETHAPANKQIVFHVKNLNDIVSEFESSDLHFEKIVPSGSDAVVYVHPLKPGRYNYYDDFHHATQGYLVVQ